MNRGYVHRATVGADLAGERLLAWLARRWRHGRPRGDPAIELAWRERLEMGELEVEGAIVRADVPLEAWQEVAWRRPPWEEPEVPLSFALLHRDDDLLAVAKPAGLPSMPSGGRFLEHTLLHRVRSTFPEATLLHRLDRGTSGIVLLARTELARRDVALAWQWDQVRRHYVGLVEGTPREESFELDAPIGSLPHPSLGRVFAVASGGKPSRTRARVLERRGATTLLAIEIDSGRPHQIRIHLAHAGLPLVGEPFFGKDGAPRAEGSALPGDVGYRLHAERIVLPHPSRPLDAPPLEIWCAPPPDLRR
jgi:23S rRNA pseudouridine1911/1915/1917 synthase